MDPSVAAFSPKCKDEHIIVFDGSVASDAPSDIHGFTGTSPHDPASFLLRRRVDTACFNSAIRSQAEPPRGSKPNPSDFLNSEHKRPSLGR